MAVIDAADVGLVEGDNWWALEIRRRRDKAVITVYACTQRGRQFVLMHRVLCLTELQVDHEDGDGLNNRRVNLRPATPTENRWNTGTRITNRSGIKGVHWHKQRDKWCAQIRVDGKHLHLGLFDTLEAAAAARAAAAAKNHGEFARTG